ncbi:MAG: glycosyltransferase family 4 protein [Bacteroidetes bacterium]|nr:glycosyltransferase family 4 protein [Bacteroidota bacterium]
MKRLLIITYYWPPSGGAGVQRWLKFVKYLREFGWEPVIFTPSNPEFPELDTSLVKDVPEGIEVLSVPIWEPYSAYKRFIGRGKNEKISAGFLSEHKKPGLTERISVWIRGNLFIPDARKFWIRPSVRFLNKYLSKNPVKVVISTGPPHSCHIIGLHIKQLHNIPWIADFRDPWTCIDFYQELRLTKWADRKHHRLEKQVLASANEVIMISPSQAELFYSIYPREYQVITNGFDQEDYPPEKKQKTDEKFSIAHIGSLVPSRNPEILWEALQQLLSELPQLAEDLQIKLVGKVDYSVIESITARGLLPYLNKIDYLPHDEVVNIQFRSQILLLLINNTPNAAAILTGKFFEYLAVRRPILCIGPTGGDAANILCQTKAGENVTYTDLTGMEDILRNYYKKYKEGALVVESVETESFSREQLTKTLACLLDRLSDRSA